MILKWFSAGASERFGRELAEFLLRELSASLRKRDEKFNARSEKVLMQADRRVRAFTQHEKMNIYKKGKMTNAFLWALKGGGCPQDYADQLTEWLTFRL